jgi:hypothetical protein
MINHWGTNNTGWGGLATPNITRYMFVEPGAVAATVFPESTTRLGQNHGA